MAQPRGLDSGRYICWTAFANQCFKKLYCRSGVAVLSMRKLSNKRRGIKVQERSYQEINCLFFSLVYLE